MTMTKRTAVMALLAGVMLLGPARMKVARGDEAAAAAAAAEAAGEAEDAFGADIGDVDVEDADNGEFFDADADDVDAEAAEGGPQASAAEVERLQRLFSQLSPECNEQVQLAYTEGKEITEECKQEVGAIMQRENGNNAGAGAAKPAKSNNPDPTGTIIGFVVLLLAGLVAWGVYAQRNIIDKMPETKTKKLSKQKQLKLKLKEQRAAAGVQ